MSDISNQLIKDSYNYVLQSDLSSGTVYRIGGSVPVNPKFLSGLTVMEKFVYSDGTEQPNYVLLTDGTGLAFWGPMSASTPSSGVTSITAGFGLSGNVTTGAVTLINTAPDQTVTITGGTNIQITGTYPDFGVNFTGSTTGGTVSGDYLPLSGGTVTGGTVFQSGLTANTISATIYYNLPVSAVTNGAGISASTTNGTVTITNTLPDQTVTISGGTGIITSGTYPNFTITNSAPDQTVTITGGTNIQINGAYPNFGVIYTGQTSFPYLPLSGGTVFGNTYFTSGLTASTLTVTGLTVNGALNVTGTTTSTTISATTYQNLPVSAITSSTYITATPNDGNYTISLNGPLLSYYVSGSTPGGTQVSGDRWLNTNTGDELVWVDDGDSQQWIQISSIVGGNTGGGGATFIASSNCLITSDANIYIGHSKGGGWSYYQWDLTDNSFDYGNVDCGVPIPENIIEGQIINVCGVAYSAGGPLEGLRLYIYKLSCSNLSTINNVYVSINQLFDSNGNLCFSFNYVVGAGEDFTKCSDFIVLGFQGGSTSTGIKISYKITVS